MGETGIRTPAYHHSCSQPRDVTLGSHCLVFQHHTFLAVKTQGSEPLSRSRFTILKFTAILNPWRFWKYIILTSVWGISQRRSTDTALSVVHAPTIFSPLSPNINLLSYHSHPSYTIYCYTIFRPIISFLHGLRDRILTLVSASLLSSPPYCSYFSGPRDRLFILVWSPPWFYRTSRLRFWSTYLSLSKYSSHPLQLPFYPFHSNFKGGRVVVCSGSESTRPMTLVPHTLTNIGVHSHVKVKLEFVQSPSFKFGRKSWPCALTIIRQANRPSFPSKDTRRSWGSIRFAFSRPHSCPTTLLHRHHRHNHHFHAASPPSLIITPCTPLWPTADGGPQVVRARREVITRWSSW